MLLILLIVIAGFALYISAKPDTFSVQRSTIINASPEKIVGFINDFHNWNMWSPWEKMEPNVEKKFSGAEKGVGAIYEWKGNKTGEGRMEIVESSAAKVSLKLDFNKPIKANNMTDFVLERKGDATHVTWIMSGKNNFMSKAMQTVMPMDKLVGGDFEKGLADLKEISEK